MEKARVGIIVDSLNSSKQIFDFIEASKNSNNYEISHLIIQKKDKQENINLLKKSLDYIKKRGLKKFISAVGFKAVSYTHLTLPTK